jgi:hypothetical protein
MRPTVSFERSIIVMSVLTATPCMDIVRRRDRALYQDLGADHFARRNPAREAEKLAKRIRSLGFDVDIRAAA